MECTAYDQCLSQAAHGTRVPYTSICQLPGVGVAHFSHPRGAARKREECMEQFWRASVFGHGVHFL